jgi:hypothetical protein
VKIDGVRTQDVEIFFSFIGKFELPGEAGEESLLAQKVHLAQKGKAKPRRDMTEEELRKERERDRIRYAEKTAAKKAAAQAERAAILEGTSFAERIDREGELEDAS